MTAVVDDYAAIAARLRALAGSRSGAAATMPIRALGRHVTEPGIIPPDPSSGTGIKAPPAQPGTANGNADPDWPYCFWFAPVSRA